MVILWKLRKFFWDGKFGYRELKSKSPRITLKGRESKSEEYRRFKQQVREKNIMVVMGW